MMRSFRLLKRLYSKLEAPASELSPVVLYSNDSTFAELSGNTLLSTPELSAMSTTGLSLLCTNLLYNQRK